MTKICALYLLAIAAINTAAAELFPMNVGDKWIYSIRSTYPGCPTGEAESVVVQEQTIDGRRAFEVQPACAGSDKIIFSIHGEIVEMESHGAWYRILDVAQENYTWNEYKATATWNNVGAITVQRRTYQNCWRKTRNVPFTDWYEFCPSAGLVSSHMIDLVGGFIDMELKEYKSK